MINIREIKGDPSGVCDVCNEWKPTVMFDDEERGYEGYSVHFEICLDCARNKINEVLDNTKS